jgi:hypothetical protein
MRREVLAIVISLVVVLAFLAGYLLIDVGGPTSPIVTSEGNSGANAPSEVQTPASGGAEAQDDQHKPSGNLKEP